MRYLVATLLFVVVQSAVADDTIDRYGVLPKIQQVALSPDGNRFAYRQVDLKSDIVVVVQLEPMRNLTIIDVSSVKPKHVSFLNNDNLVMKVSQEKRVAGFKGKFEVSTAITYNIKKKRYKQLLVPGAGNVYPGQMGMGRIIGVSPDNKYVYMPAFSGLPGSILGKGFSPEYSLFRIKITGAGASKIYQSGYDTTKDFFVGDDGVVLAREDFDDQKNRHSLSAYNDKKWIEVFSEQTPYTNKSFVGVTADEQHVIMLDDSQQTRRDAVYKISLADGRTEGPLFDRVDADIDRVITNRQRKVIGVEYSGFNPSYLFFDIELNKRVQNILARFPNHSVSIIDGSKDWQDILVLVEGAHIAGDYYLFSEGEKPRFITLRYADIPDDVIHPVGVSSFTARDGRQIPTLLTIPRNKVDDMKSLPAVVLPHGGPASHDMIGFNYEAQALAEQGYLVIQPQFRGSSGFGSEHQVAGYGEWGRKMQNDITDAVKYYTSKGVIDADRVCIVGGSYGGYAALAGGAFTPSLYKCVVSINGIANLQSFREWVRSEHGRSSESLEYWETQIGGDNYGKNMARERSPQFSAAAFTAPVLLIHAERDNIVPVSQSKKMFKVLKKQGKHVEKLILKGDDHHLSQGETRLKSLRAMVDFVNRYIGKKD